MVAPLAASAGHPGSQVLLEGLDAPVHHRHGVAVLRSLGAVHRLIGQLPVQRGELVAQVRRDHEVLVVPLVGKADASALAALLSTVDGLDTLLEVDTKIANALLRHDPERLRLEYRAHLHTDAGTGWARPPTW